MSKNRLVVCEKPSVAKSISAVLGANSRKDGYYEGNGYIVSYCFGHLVGLAEPEEYHSKFAEKPWKVENLPILPNEHGGWKFTVNKSAEKQFQVVRKFMNSPEISEIINACDAGREGECIFRYVYHAANCNKSVSRLWVSSLEESAIREGFKNLRPGSDFDNLYASGFARARADFIVGMNLTRLQSALHRTFLSVGRVQTPTLAMIVERDNKVKNFVKEKYFMVGLSCGNFTASSVRIDNLSEAEKIKSKCDGNSATVTSIKREKKTVNPPKLYDLTTLQREANRYFSYSAQQTLDYAQALYEKSLLSYPRTNSQYITENTAETATAVIGIVCDLFGIYKGVVPNIKQIINENKVSDHHGLLPTPEIAKADLSSLTEGEYNILSLVACRLLCAVGDPHEYEAVTAEIECGGNIFTARGKTVIYDGWKQSEKSYKNSIKSDIHSSEDLFEVKSGEEVLSVSEEQIFDNPVCLVTEKWTSPPSPYTEDTLLKSMETAGNKDYEADSAVDKKGIGTPATRANCIETLIKRGYVVRNKKNLVSTEKGATLIEIVPESVKSAKLTADWETALAKISKGEYSADDFMAQIEKLTIDIISSAMENVNTISASFQNKIGVCPKCKSDIVANSKAYSCVARCGFVVCREIAKKTIPEVQAKKLLERGKSDEISGFISKTGNEFTAKLVLKVDFSVGFEFPAKSGKGGKSASKK